MLSDIFAETVMDDWTLVGQCSLTSASFHLFSREHKHFPAQAQAQAKAQPTKRTK
jgi:hypothetical protein